MTNPDQKEYSAEAILALSAAIERNENAFDWLTQNEQKELAALAEVILFSKNEAMEWLKNNHFNNVVSFVGALNEDEDAINYLMMNDGKAWAATAEVVNGSDNAQEWLERFFPHFEKLADAIIAIPPRRRGGFPSHI